MSTITISGQPCRIQGEFTPPGDKSISHRTVILGSLAEGKSNIKGFLQAADTLSTLNAFRNMGVEITQNDSEIIVKGDGLNSLSKPSKKIDAGNSGTTARLLTGLLSAQPFNSEIIGDKYLSARPMGRIISPLTKMGAKISSNNQKLPLKIEGQNLKGITYELPVASAQVKSSLILAGLYASGETRIIEPTKTRDHTERMLKYLGANIDISENIITVSSPDPFKGAELIVPSDISSASFFIVAAIINPGSELLIRNVGLNTERTGLIDILLEMGADIKILNKKEQCGEEVGDLVVRSSKLKAINISGELVPKAIDELPIISVAACFAEGESKITEASELRVKETDRIKAITTELKKLGADIEELDDGMVIRGKEALISNTCDSWGDHRIAMSLAIAATKAEGESKISDSQCINISFPRFFEILSSLRN